MSLHAILAAISIGQGGVSGWPVLPNVSKHRATWAKCTAMAPPRPKSLDTFAYFRGLCGHLLGRSFPRRLHKRRRPRLGNDSGSRHTPILFSSLSGKSWIRQTADNLHFNLLSAGYGAIRPRGSWGQIRQMDETGRDGFQRVCIVENTLLVHRGTLIACGDAARNRGKGGSLSALRGSLHCSAVHRSGYTSTAPPP